MSLSKAPCAGKAPCGTCPYRRDVPAGVWAADEYAKLPPYDGETCEQPPQLFFCHQQDGRLCAGWVGCHDTQNLLSMRLHRVDPSVFDYESPVPLFASGTEAAAHGLSGVTAPAQDARRAIEKLARKLSAQGIEAGTATTTQIGVVHESPVGGADAPRQGGSRI